MFNLGKFRRGQIRGIDFSLAMIIFLLTMSQVLVLTTTFIENSQSAQDVSSDINYTETLSNSFLSSTGYSTSTGNIQWYTATTTDLVNTGWKFGLKNSEGDIDPFRIGRLATNSYNSYALSYNEVKGGTTVERDFKISFLPTLNMSIISVVNTGTTIDIVGFGSSYGNGIENVKVNLFIYDFAAPVQQTLVNTNSTGYFSASVVPNDINAGLHVVAAIGSFGVGNQDAAIEIVGTFTSSSQTILPGSGNGYSVDVVADNLLNQNVEQVALYSGFGQNYTQTTPGITGSSYTGTLSIPQRTLVIVFTIEESAGSYAISTTTFPLISDGETADPIAPNDPFGTKATVYEQIVNVRGTNLRYSVTTWS